ncbi:hypothetical protein [Kineosporia babensis]|uniref:Uncharacterized protein n=1 Tax=Kineosporia babensis TaxID=499548 RepID=A0A9X1SZA7_9ACTN|nr:hypothetical protein [Kineosporia babensis]MCD5317260.1 hypothetical protein [Kineosporia babensis]
MVAYINYWVPLKVQERLRDMATPEGQKRHAARIEALQDAILGELHLIQTEVRRDKWGESPKLTTKNIDNAIDAVLNRVENGLRAETDELLKRLETADEARKAETLRADREAERARRAEERAAEAEARVTDLEARAGQAEERAGEATKRVDQAGVRLQQVEDRAHRGWVATACIAGAFLVFLPVIITLLMSGPAKSINSPSAWLGASIAAMFACAVVVAVAGILNRRRGK